MLIRSAVVGLGAGAVAAAGTGFVSNGLMNKVAVKHPTGSDAEVPLRAIQTGGVIAGGIGIGAGLHALSHGHVTLGVGLIGTGLGTVGGSLGAGAHFRDSSDS